MIVETIIAFAWEPNGSKFAVLHGEAPRISVSFYHVKSNGKIELISEYSRPVQSGWQVGTYGVEPRHRPTEHVQVARQQLLGPEPSAGRIPCGFG